MSWGGPGGYNEAGWKTGRFARLHHKKRPNAMARTVMGTSTPTATFPPSESPGRGGGADGDWTGGEDWVGGGAVLLGKSPSCQRTWMLAAWRPALRFVPVMIVLTDCVEITATPPDEVTLTE